MNENIFLNKIYRNNYIRSVIFRQIKLTNKNLKYIRYNFYDTPLSLIINNQNEHMLVEKLTFYQTQKNNQLENNIVDYDNHYKYYLEFNIQDYKKLLSWKNLNLDTFKIYFNTFQNEILKLSQVKELFEILILENGVSVDILKFVMVNNGYRQKLFFTLSLELTQYREYIKEFTEKLPFNLSLEMFEYLFKSTNETSGLFELKIEDFHTIIEIIIIMLQGKCNEQVIIGFFSLLPDEFIKLAFVPLHWEKLANKIIESNNLQLFQLLLEKLQVASDQVEFVKLLGYKISKRNFERLNINLKSFTGNTMFPLFIQLVEGVYKRFNLFTNNQSLPGGILEINGPDYSDYAIEKLKSNGIPLVNQIVKFSYKCQRNECTTNEQLINNHNLTQVELMTKDHYKCQSLNKEISLFYVYLAKFCFTQAHFFEVLELGYENMCVHILENTGHINLFGLRGQNKKHLFYFQTLLKSLPSDTSHGYKPLVYKSILKIINQTSMQVPSMYIHKDFIPIEQLNPIDMFFEIINNQIFPLNPIKRELFIKKVSGVTNFSYLKSNYTYIKYKRIFEDYGWKPNQHKLIPDFLDIDKSLLVNLLNTNNFISDNFFSRLLLECLAFGSFKLIKKISKFKSNKRAYSIFSNVSFKTLFYLISELHYFKLGSLDSFSSTSDNVKLQVSTVMDFCKLPRLYESFLNLFLGIKEFQNFNFFYSLTKGMTGTKCLDIQCADKYLIISQFLLLSKISKSSIATLLKWSKDNKSKLYNNNSFQHYNENIDFIKQLYNNDQNDENIKSIKSTFKLEFGKSMTKNQGDILKLFGIYQ